jgi:hypothetical protein
MTLKTRDRGAATAALRSRLHFPSRFPICLAGTVARSPQWLVHVAGSEVSECNTQTPGKGSSDAQTSLKVIHLTHV